MKTESVQNGCHICVLKSFVQKAFPYVQKLFVQETLQCIGKESMAYNEERKYFTESVAMFGERKYAYAFYTNITVRSLIRQHLL